MLAPVVVIEQLDQPVVVIEQPDQPVEIAGPVVMPLVMVDPVVISLVVVLIVVEPVEYALVLPPLDVVVVLVRYNLEQPKVVDQAVRYLVYATEWYCRCIFQGNSSHL